MKFLTFFPYILLVLGSGSLDKENRAILPSPPDTSKMYILQYNGKDYRLTKRECDRFMDSLNLKDTLLGKLK